MPDKKEELEGMVAEIPGDGPPPVQDDSLSEPGGFNVAEGLREVLLDGGSFLDREEAAIEFPVDRPVTYRVLQQKKKKKLITPEIPSFLAAAYRTPGCEGMRRALEDISFDDARRSEIREGLQIPRFDSRDILKKLEHQGRVPSWLSFLPGESFAQWDACSDDAGRNILLTNLFDVLRQQPLVEFFNNARRIQLVAMGISSGRPMNHHRAILEELKTSCGVTEVDLEIVELSLRMLHNGLPNIIGDLDGIPSVRTGINVMSFDQLSEARLPHLTGVPRIINLLGMTERRSSFLQLLRKNMQRGDGLLINFQTVDYKNVQDLRKIRTFYSRDVFKDFALNGLFTILKAAGVPKEFLQFRLSMNQVCVEIAKRNTEVDVCFVLHLIPALADEFSRHIKPPAILRAGKIILFKVPLSDLERDDPEKQIQKAGFSILSVLDSPPNFMPSGVGQKMVFAKIE